MNMPVNASLDYGPLKVDVSADNADELEDELTEIITFLEDNDDRIASLFGDFEAPTVATSKHETVSSEDESSDVAPEIDGPLAGIAKKVRVDANTLNEIILIDHEDEEPYLFLEDVKLLGDVKTKRQRNTSLILLYLWDEIFGETRVKTTRLKDALQMSEISQSNLANMYQGQGNTLFDRSGRGASATIGLTMKGKRRARTVIQELVEVVENQSSESPDETKQAEFIL